MDVRFKTFILRVYLFNFERKNIVDEYLIFYFLSILFFFVISLRAFKKMPVENSPDIPIILQWIGLIVTIVSGVISAIVLGQTWHIKKAFFLKAKLPKLYKRLSNYRSGFSDLLSKNIDNINDMKVLQTQVVSILKQATPYLSKIDKEKVDSAIALLSKPIKDLKSAWSFYENLAGLESHVGESSDDLRWNS